MDRASSAKSVLLSDPGHSRYRRQLLLKGIGPEGQEKLRRATVLVAGVGGLGGAVALYLAAGVGRLVLVHAGPIDLPDLNRQILMTDAGIGRSRVHVARETLHRFNPEVRVDVVDDRSHEGNISDLLQEADLSVSCRYNFEERDLLNRASVTSGKPVVEAAMYGMEFYLTTLIPGATPCLRCIYPEFPSWDPLGFPVLGAVSGTLGCLAAAEAVKLITGMGQPLRGTLLYGDLSDMTFRKFRVKRQPGCFVCGDGDGI
ncbi:MAG: HesA/MoeB/ThiF family protein [Nitrospirae bacterium]|nr:HesA/MoeB/ThiF family protein [Nitrospirota bacterium]